MRKLLTILVFSAVAVTAFGVPAQPGAILRYQPDGTVDTVYLHGDEYYHYVTDSKDRIIQGSECRDTSLWRANSARRAPQKLQRAAYVPLSGKVRVPVLLVNFTDQQFTLDNAVSQFDDLFNGNGGSNPNATGSVHTYYEASSSGVLDLEYEVLGPYDLSREMEYYGYNRKNNSGEVISHSGGAAELVTEVVRLAADAGIDFRRYDADNDGVIDNVSIVVAGYNEAEGGKEETIWPHYSTMSQSLTVSGKTVKGYLMISEYRGSGGNHQAGIGTYCHEFGHALGLPDLYDTQVGENYTVGSWDVMCVGCYNNSGSTPPTFTAFERFVLGWMLPEQVTTSGLRSLRPIETHNEALLIAADKHNLRGLSPNPAEYFLLENRQAIGWDAGKEALVGTGLLVTHITFNSASWDNNTFNCAKPLGFDIVSAGMTAATHSSAADIFPGTTKRTVWQPTLNDGTVLNELVVSQIRQRADSTMLMYIGGISDDILAFDPGEIELTTTYLDEPVTFDTARFLLRVPKTQQDSLSFIMETSGFVYSIDSGAHWHDNTDTAWLCLRKDTIYSVALMAVHVPSRARCGYTYSFLSAESKDHSLGAQLMLAGRSPRPSLITTPVIDSIGELSTHAFTVYWARQDEADGYFYTLYTIAEGESGEAEEFEQFETFEQIRDQGWDANFLNSQGTLSQDGKALLFTQDDEFIRTPVYLYTPHRISFWLTNNYTPNGVDETFGGMLYLSGTADGSEWKDLAKFNIQRITKNVTQTVELDTALHLKQFRLSYKHIGGNGGVIVDSWTAHFPMDIQYLYHLREHLLYSDANSIAFRNLEPGTDYWYAMQAYDEKGCVPAYSTLSTPVKVHTKDTPDKQKLLISRKAQGKYSVTLPDASDGKHTLAVYDEAGNVIFIIKPAYGVTTVELPVLQCGKAYVVKFYGGTMTRKDVHARLLCY